MIATFVSGYAAGSPQQHHVHFASNLGAYVVFYLSPQNKNALLTRITPDFQTFVDGPSLPLPRPHDNEGRNFDVAYANIGGADVFHLVISIHDGMRYSYRARGRATKGGVLAFDSPSELGHGDFHYDTLDPDGPAVSILASGRVVISSGYNSVEGHTANAVVWMANKADDGAVDWDHAFAPGVELQTAAQSVNARSLLPIPGGASLIWEAGDKEPKPTQLHYALFDGNAWSGPDDVGFPPQPFDVADYNQVRTPDGRIHAVRYGAGAYLHRYHDTTGHDGFPIATAAHSEGDGLVLLAPANDAVAFALDAADKVLRKATLSSDHWSAWASVAPADASRSHLSGSGDVLMWQRGSDLVGLRLAP